MMKKRTVLITGGAKRVGKEIALSLANKDTNLIIHYNKSLLEARKLKLLLEERGSKCALIKSNLSNQKDLKKIMNNAKKFFGTINCLINNASLFLNDNVESFSFSFVFLIFPWPGGWREGDGKKKFSATA